jgi:DNA-binding response OmpR family regulator
MPGHEPTVLVVEDDADQRFLYEQFLQREGFRVETAISVDETKAVLAAAKLDAIIMDLSIGGFALLEHIRASDETRDVPVLVVSGRRQDEPDVKGSRSLWNHYVEKPANLSDLARLLKHETKRR